jgi:hypothetical protein
MPFFHAKVALVLPLPLQMLIKENINCSIVMSVACIAFGFAELNYGG